MLYSGTEELCPRNIAYAGGHIGLVKQSQLDAWKDDIYGPVLAD